MGRGWLGVHEHPGCCGRESGAKVLGVLVQDSGVVVAKDEAGGLVGVGEGKETSWTVF